MIDEDSAEWRDWEWSCDEWGERPMMFTVEPGWGWFAASVTLTVLAFAALAVLFLGVLG
jgi:hypothetical protein